MDIDFRPFEIRFSSHRIIDPLSAEKLATLGSALGLSPRHRVLDLACGKGELLSTWARAYGVRGIGVDLCTTFIEAANQRATELGVAEQLTFEHRDAAGYVVGDPVDVAACLGASWIGDGIPGTLELLERSLRPGGLALLGEPFWQTEPADRASVLAQHGMTEDLPTMPELGAYFQELGWDIVELVLSDVDSWDRYTAAQWLNMRRFCDANPHDELAESLRADLAREPVEYLAQRGQIGWGVFVLMRR